MSTKDQKIKEFLQTKRIPLDEWNTHEQLCLASAVACSGDQNWMSVSRALKGIVSSYNSRPTDWFISKSCATQYGKLLESVETPKRKKRTASERDQPAQEQAPSTPVESLVKKLTTERIIELKKAIAEKQQQYTKVREEIAFLQSSSLDETKIREMWNQLEQEKIQKEHEQIRHDQWLKEREEKKREHERQWRGPYKANIRTQKSTQDEIEPDTTTATTPIQQTGTSPLLTSLLKSPSQTQVTTTTVQQSSVSSSSSNSARIAPTITNLLTGSSSSQSSLSSASSSNTPIIITQNPSSSLIASSSASSSMVQNIINASSSSSIVSHHHSHSAPTLIDLLDKKSSSNLVSSTSSQDAATNEKQQLLMSISVPESGGKDGDMVKDEEAELLADFKELIDAEKFDIDEDLEDLNSIIMNPEILEEKISDGEPIKDVDDSSQATSTDDYDKLKIKQIVETIQDFAGVASDVPHQPQPQQHQQQQQQPIIIPEEPHEKIIAPVVEEAEVIQVPSEAENSQPASVEMIEAPMESNDSKPDSPPPDDSKIVMISDESSNTNDEKKEEMSDKIDTNEESQSVDEIKDPSGDDSNKETQAFQGISNLAAESDENSVSSEKEQKESTVPFQLEDSEDAIFEDAKEINSENEKVQEADPISVKEPSPEKSLPEAPEKSQKTIVTESEEASRSAIDSDDEVLEIKASRSTMRKKVADSLKADTPSSSTRSRDHSENDDNRDSTPIRTRSRHSSTAVSESKSTFNFSKEQDHSMWKARWEDCTKELQKLKEFSQIIDNKIVQDDFYKKVCLHPMNMKMIAKNIESHASTMPSEIKRDFVLMCTNMIMLNTKGAKFNEMVNQFAKDGMEIIDSHMEVEDSYKAYRKQIRKPQIP